MVRGRFLLHIAAFALPLLTISTSAWGDILPTTPVNGTVWRVYNNWASAPTSALDPMIASGTHEGTFTATGINFLATGTQTLGDFLSFGGANTVLMTGGLGDLLSNASTSGFRDCPNHDCYSTVIELTGTWTFLAGQTYTLTHDDGAVMFAGGNFTTPVINSPGPTGSLPSTWTPLVDTAGAFDIWYMGTNQNPEVLQLSGTAVPEPASILFLGTACLALGGLLRRRFRAE